MAFEAPSIVLVQGSFQTPLVYAQLTTGLRELGYPVIHPPLPSCSDVEANDFPTRTHHHRNPGAAGGKGRKAGRCCNAFLRGHCGRYSYSQISHPCFATVRGEKGRCFAFILLCCLCSTGGRVGDGNFCRTVASASRTEQKLSTAISRTPRQALWESRLIPQSSLVQTTPTTRAAYEYLPSTYLICEGDQAAPAQFQEGFASLARAKIDHCSAGHSPMLSQPGMLGRKIAAVVGKASAGTP